MDGFTDWSQKHLSVSAIIPARNEALNLQYVLPHIPSFVTEVILVDGHSTDETVTMARRLMPEIRIIEQKGHGKGDAIRTGLAVSTGDIIILLDADGSTDPLEIPHFVNALLEGCDFAKGSRFIKGGSSHDITFLRRAGNRGLILLVNVLFGTRFSDLCYGYNAFWRHCLAHIEIDSDGFEIETLINIRTYLAGLNIVEVPSVEYQRVHGLSNLNTFRDGWRVLKLILQERRSGKRRPAMQSVTRVIQRSTMYEEAIGEIVL
jgi:glycosyltransferase involved in cell wall biosynthesis